MPNGRDSSPQAPEDGYVEMTEQKMILLLRFCFALGKGQSFSYFQILSSRLSRMLVYKNLLLSK